MRRMIGLGVAVLLALSLSGCGDCDDCSTTGPGFVGIDDSAVDTAPLLAVTYQDPLDPLLGEVVVQIFSDPAADGDIFLDPVSGIYTLEREVTPLFFGVDSNNSDLPEYRTFLTFPLDSVPLGVTITFATVELFVTQVSFTDTVPTFLDLVQYGFQNPALDFNAPPLAFRTLDFFSSDPGNFVLIEVTPLMETAQVLALPDFQIRLSLDGSTSVTQARPASSGVSPQKAARIASPSSFAARPPERTTQENESLPETEAGRPTRVR